MLLSDTFMLGGWLAGRRLDAKQSQTRCTTRGMEDRSGNKIQ